MKKMKVFLLVLFAGILIIQMYGLTDSVKAQKAPITFEPTAMNISVWIFMSWTFFLILISIPFYFNYRRIKLRQQVISNLIEKGQEIPKELLSRPSVPGRSDLHKGIILIGLGISIIIVLLSLNISNNYWTAGFIPLLLGIAYLISFKLDERKKMESE